MKKLHLFGSACACIVALITATASAATIPLESRLGGLAYYDQNLDITWAANADINGDDTWDNQMAWVASLEIGGVTGWRLPSADVNGDGSVVDCFGGGVVGCEDTEMGYLYWEEGITPATPGPFLNVLSDDYWFGTEYAPFPDIAAERFDFSNGVQVAEGKSTAFRAWAVHAGDVGGSVVPIPAVAWLFASGLLGIIGVARRS